VRPLSGTSAADEGGDSTLMGGASGGEAKGGMSACSVVLRCVLKRVNGVNQFESGAEEGEINAFVVTATEIALGALAWRRGGQERSPGCRAREQTKHLEVVDHG
jgi:hypothetical protein